MLENKTLRIVLGGATIVGVSYLAYRLWKTYFKKSQQIKRRPSQESVEEHRLNTIQSNYSEFYFDKEEQLRNIVAKLQEKGPTIEDIYLLSPLILVDQYVKYTKEIRKRRRLIRKTNEEQYVGLIRNYEFQIKELLNRGREEVMEEFGHSPDDLNRMQTAFEMFDNLEDLRKKAIAQLRGKAFPVQKLRRIPKSKLRHIMQEQINFISNRMYQRMKVKLQQGNDGISQQEIYKVIITLIDDIIYEKYGYEREEIEKQINQLPILYKDLTKFRTTLLRQIGDFNFDSLESPEGSEAEQVNNKESVSAITTILDDSRQVQ